MFVMSFIFECAINEHCHITKPYIFKRKPFAYRLGLKLQPVILWTFLGWLIRLVSAEANSESSQTSDI